MGWAQAEPLLFFRGVLSLALKAFQMMKSGPPGLPRITSLIIASQLIMDFNNISKCLHSKRRFMFGQLGAVTKGHTEVTHQKTITIPPHLAPDPPE